MSCINKTSSPCGGHVSHMEVQPFPRVERLMPGELHTRRDTYTQLNNRHCNVTFIDNCATH